MKELTRATAVVIMFAVAFALLPEAPAADIRADIVAEAKQTLERGLDFFKTLRVNGGWPMAYSEDLERRWGEHAECQENSITVQPPATPTVGSVYLRASSVLGSGEYRSIARQTADALIAGQLDNGGWWHEIQFDEKGNAIRSSSRATMDDNTTQGATMFMMEIARVTRAPLYVSSARSALEFLLDSQYLSGGWPQQYPASNGYSSFYTLNDAAINDCISTLLAGYRQFHDERYLDAAERAVAWLIVAQLPAPQRGWAQQYDLQMRPAPARWFEPAACCSAVTVRVIRTLIDLHLETGDDKYLEPIPAALEWLKASQLEDGTWARFYETGSNKPIYVTAERQIVYKPENLRPGYSWKGSYGVPETFRMYRVLKEQGVEKLREHLNPEPDDRSLVTRAQYSIESQRDDGSWVGDGRISCGAFVEACTALCNLLERAQRSP
jgi:hypothetical protein